ncbi:MAG: flavin reductase family protein [Thermaurantimonas sp.]|uniref:flavin reductase family protein n=1 Tax=Thermaurantimonas sp. TaxID=2681568 RepID=UPI003918D83A
MLKIKPGDIPVPKFQGLLQHAVAPRPIALASTVDANGNPNLSPFSFFNVFSANPPILVFSPARRVRNNTTKDTLENVLATREVVINVVTYAMVYQASLASSEYPTGVNEFIKSGFTPIESEIVKPFRVKESPVQFECRVNDVIALGNQGGAGHLVISEVLLVHVSPDILNAEGMIDQHKIDLVARLGKNWYSRNSGSALFEVDKPLEKLGVGVDAIPAEAKESGIFTGNDLGRLGNVEKLPATDEIYSFIEQLKNENPTYANIHQWSKDELFRLAKDYLQDQDGDPIESWMILLYATEKAS